MPEGAWAGSPGFAGVIPHVYFTSRTSPCDLDMVSNHPLLGRKPVTIGFLTRCEHPISRTR